MLAERKFRDATADEGRMSGRILLTNIEENARNAK